MTPVKIGIVGLHFGLQYMKQQIGSENEAHYQVMAVADLEQSARAEGMAVFNCPGYASLEAMLAEADIEAVALFSGPVGRAELIRTIIRAGKDVMTTKPFELDSSEAASVLAEARNLGRIIHLNSPATVPGADIAQILAWQKDYALGELVFARLDCWYQSLEKADGSWYDDPKRCPVAPCFRLGIYGINDLISISNSPPVEVQALYSRMKTGRPTPDVGQLSIRFENGAIGVIRDTWRCRPSRGVLDSEFVFENGVVKREYDPVPDGEPKTCTLTLTAEDAKGSIETKQAQIPVAHSNHSYRWDLFQQAVRGKTIDGQVEDRRIVDAIRIVEAMKRAQTSQQTERI